MTIGLAAKQHLKSGFDWLISNLFPAQCPSCSASVNTPGSLCANCWSAFNFISDPVCCQCGYPFDYGTGNDLKCASCITKNPPYTAGRSVFSYDDQSRQAILSFKHADRTDKVPAFASWMIRAGADLLHDNPLLVPVPLHPLRLISRRFNQSALLAKAIGRQSGLQVATRLLKRTRNTSSQGGKSAKVRFQNVKGAFSVTASQREKLQGRTVILIDDVFTTGATLEACAHALVKAGAAEVRFLTLSRVVRASALPI
ncbi:ComF family protein [Sneathiella limimaris]|uniref:ComF family protein n=1 Tax=Sneathiella limimaris TaxID=1964213 RepID=UPI00146CEB45|nr:ComF family protein [Sneathiella limimaris]